MRKIKFLTSVVLIILLPYVNSTSGPNWPKSNKHFVLVHGARHGAWSWYKIVALLKSSGHNVTAIELSASGINPKQVLQIPRLSHYFSPLMDFMASHPADQKVVLVGHSLGGLAISKAMEIFPEKISVAVFLAALMPGPTLNATTLYTTGKASFWSCRMNVKSRILRIVGSEVMFQIDNRVTYDNGSNNPPTTFNFGPKYLASYLYQLSPIQDLALATTLVRPIYFYGQEDVSKEMALSSKKYGSIRRVFIGGAEDKILRKELKEYMIENNPSDEVEDISGSDHMVMMSKPLQLFTLLLRSAKKY